MLEALRETWRTGQPHHVPMRKYADERITQWVENRVFRLPSGQVVAVYDDRTELMRLEDELRQAQKIEAVGTLAGGIVHDFNNMLNIITVNVSYAQSLVKGNDELSEALADALKGADQAEQLTRQLVTFARGGEPIRELSDINGLVESIAGLTTRGTKSTCELELAAQLWGAEVDATQINQVLGNLLINADQAMPDGGVISIEAENCVLGPDDRQPLEGPYVKIRIADQGSGIAAGHLGRIFDPYFTTKEKGSGLGLAAAYSIVNRHGGHISVSSELGRGTAFRICLPAAPGAVLEARDQKRSEHCGQGRILLMDDQEPVLRSLARMLTKMGYETEGVTDGAQAIARYRKAQDAGRPFDLVILDLTVPGGMGGGPFPSC